MFSLNIALAEDVLEDILKVYKLLVLIVELDELSRRGLSRDNSRRQNVGQPKFSVGHFDDGNGSRKRSEGEKENVRVEDGENYGGLEEG